MSEKLCELAQWTTWGVIEVMVRNPNVDSFVREKEAEIERLRGLVYALSDALTDEGPDWSDQGLQNLRARAAAELPEAEWLQPYLAKATKP